MFKLLAALIHCFFREIHFPKLNFQNSEHLITLASLPPASKMENEKVGGWGRKQLGLVLVKPDLSRDLFFFWLQIRCSNQAVFENSEGMSMGFLARLILEHRHIPRGQSAQVHCLLERSLGGRAWQVTFFFPVGGHPSIISGMASPSHSKGKAAGAVQGDYCLATSQSRCPGKRFQLTFLVFTFFRLDVGT